MFHTQQNRKNADSGHQANNSTSSITSASAGTSLTTSANSSSISSSSSSSSSSSTSLSSPTHAASLSSSDLPPPISGLQALPVEAPVNRSLCSVGHLRGRSRSLGTNSISASNGTAPVLFSSKHGRLSNHSRNSSNSSQQGRSMSRNHNHSGGSESHFAHINGAGANCVSRMNINIPTMDRVNESASSSHRSPSKKSSPVHSQHGSNAATPLPTNSPRMFDASPAVQLLSTSSSPVPLFHHHHQIEEDEDDETHFQSGDEVDAAVALLRAVLFRGRRMESLISPSHHASAAAGKELALIVHGVESVISLLYRSKLSYSLRVVELRRSMAKTLAEQALAPKSQEEKEIAEWIMGHAFPKGDLERERDHASQAHAFNTVPANAFSVLHHEQHTRRHSHPALYTPTQEHGGEDSKPPTTQTTPQQKEDSQYSPNSVAQQTTHKMVTTTMSDRNSDNVTLQNNLSSNLPLSTAAIKSTAVASSSSSSFSSASASASAAAASASSSNSSSSSSNASGVQPNLSPLNVSSPALLPISPPTSVLSQSNSPPTSSRLHRSGSAEGHLSPHAITKGKIQRATTLTMSAKSLKSPPGITIGQHAQLQQQSLIAASLVTLSRQNSLNTNGPASPLANIPLTGRRVFQEDKGSGASSASYVLPSFSPASLSWLPSGIMTELSMVALGTASSWDFDIFEFSRCTNAPLSLLSAFLLERNGLFDQFAVDRTVFWNFMTEIEAGYLQVPYHNALHAADVLQNLNCIIHGFHAPGAAQSQQHFPINSDPNMFSPSSAAAVANANVSSIIVSGSAPTTEGTSIDGGIRSCLTTLDLLAGFIAAAIHDFRHTGQNNAYHVNTWSPIAMRYNDKAVLENYHLAEAFEVLLKPRNFFLSGLPIETRKELRESIIAMVLATDMRVHVKLVSELQATVEQKRANREWFSVACSADRLLLLKNALHIADLGNPAKRRDVYLQWASRVMQEFYLQGDLERSKGLQVSPMMDRMHPHIERSQIGFIDFIIAPYLQAWAGVCPSASIAIENMKANRNYFESVAPPVSPIKPIRSGSTSRPNANSSQNNTLQLPRSVPLESSVSDFESPRHPMTLTYAANVSSPLREGIAGRRLSASPRSAFVVQPNANALLDDESSQ